MVFLCLTLLFHKLFQGIIALTDPDVFFLGIQSEKFSKCAGLITEIPFVCEIKDFINEKYDGAVVPFDDSADSEENTDADAAEEDAEAETEDAE